MKKVIIATNYSGPYEGNFICSLRKLSEELNKENIKLVLILPQISSKYDWTNNLKLWCENVIFINQNNLLEANKLAKFLKSNEVSFVHTHFATFKTIAIVRLALLISTKKITVIEHWHNHYSISGNIIKRLIKKILISSDKIIACSYGVAQSLEAANLKNEICYIRNAIDFSRFNNDELQAKGTLSERFSRLNILIFGFDFQRKGVDIALIACERLMNNGIDLQLRICAAVGMEQVEKKTLEILNVGTLPNWIEILPPTEHIQKYYEEANVFISPSREEGFPYSLVEAAYCGCLLIATNISGQNELDFEDIHWISPNNVEQLTCALEFISTLDIERQKQLSYKYHNEALSKYQINKWTNDLIKYYRDHNLI